MVEPLNKKLKKKRKANSIKLTNQNLFNNNNDNDNELDTSVLEYVSKNGLEYNEDINKMSKIDENNNNDNEVNIDSKFKVNSKKM